jgi:hypothetical protein
VKEISPVLFTGATPKVRVSSVSNLRRTVGESTTNQSEATMGDRSPKSVQKQAAQKLTKANAAAQKKQAATAAKAIVGKR